VKTRQQQSTNAAVTKFDAPVVSLFDAHRRRVFCVLLALAAVLSFRSVPRVLGHMQPLLALPMPAPHFTSVINWSLRVGLASLKAVSTMVEPWIALIDMSIDVGIQKVLVVLRVPLSALRNSEGGLSLRSCECIACVVRDSWKGEDVATALTATFSQSGPPIAFVRDGGGDIRRGILLWKMQAQLGRIAVIADVGHAVACALKAKYARLKAFRRAMSAIAAAAKKLGQSDLSYLTPLRLRTKGRFLGITKLAKWAFQALELIGGSGPQAAGSLACRLRKMMPRFGIHRPFLDEFTKTCTVIEDFLILFKNKGVNQTNAAAGRRLLDQLPDTCKVRAAMSKWLVATLAAQCRLGIGQIPLAVSTDVLECLFGKFKTVIQRSPKADFNQTVLTIPALCGTLDENSVDRALRQVSHKDLMHWRRAHVAQTQIQKRRSFLASGQVPDPGNTHPP